MLIWPGLEVKNLISTHISLVRTQPPGPSVTVREAGECRRAHGFSVNAKCFCHTYTIMGKIS